MKKKSQAKAMSIIFFGILFTAALVIAGSYLDPSNTNDVGLAFDGEVYELWNEYDHYFINSTSGTQLTNYEGNYWTNNVLCANVLFGTSWHKMCGEELSWTWVVDTDNSTYTHLTGFTSVSSGGWGADIQIEYHLENNWSTIRITPTITNTKNKRIDDAQFIWRVEDIQIAMTQEDDELHINNDFLHLTEPQNATYTDVPNRTFVIYDRNTTADLILWWNESKWINSVESNMTYTVSVFTEAGQYNAPIELIMDLGPLNKNDVIETNFRWIDKPGKILDGDAFTFTKDPIDNGTLTYLAATLTTASPGDAESWDVFIETDGNARITDQCGSNQIMIVGLTEDHASCAAASSNGDYNDYLDCNSLASGQTVNVNYTVLGCDPGGPTNYQFDMTTTTGGQSDFGGIDALTVDAVAPSYVQWNQSTYNFGSTVNNATVVLEINSTEGNTDVTVDCTGDCDEITNNWSTITMVDTEVQPVLINCSNETAGTFQAIFNVTSVEDTVSDLITVSCDVFTYGYLEVSLDSPIDFYNVTQNEAFDFNTTVTCKGGAAAKCGIVNAYARYNVSATTPDTNINTTQGGIPFHIVGGTSQPTVAGWWDTGWLKRKELNVQGNYGVAQTDYSVFLTIPYDSDMNSDFSDLRFVNASGNQELKYYIEAYTASTSADVWVMAPNVLPSSNQTFYMYYGNAGVSTTSNRTTAFLLFNDFSTDPFSNGWSCWDATCTYQAGTDDVDLIAGGAFSSAVMSYDTTSYNNIEVKYTESGLSSDYWFATEFRSAATGGGVLSSRQYGHINPNRIQIWAGPFIAVDDSFSTPTNVTSAFYNFSSTMTTENMTTKNETALENNSVGFDTTYVNLHGRTAATITVDNVRIRRYAIPEPTPFLGSEEAVGDGIVYWRPILFSASIGNGDNADNPENVIDKRYNDTTTFGFMDTGAALPRPKFNYTFQLPISQESRNLFITANINPASYGHFEMLQAYNWTSSDYEDIIYQDDFPDGSLDTVSRELDTTYINSTGGVELVIINPSGGSSVGSYYDLYIQTAGGGTYDYWGYTVGSTTRNATYYTGETSCEIAWCPGTDFSAAQYELINQTDVIYTGTGGVGGLARETYHFKINEIVGNIDNISISYYGYILQGSARSLDIWNSTHWERFILLPESEDNLPTIVVVNSSISNYIDSNGFFHIKIFANPITGATFNTDYVKVNVVTAEGGASAQNPLTSSMLSFNDVFMANWTVNATGVNLTQWEVGAYFNSSYGHAAVSNNFTSNSTVCIGTCISGPPPANTCTYSSGNWNVNCADGCNITSNVEAGGNDVILSGTGFFQIQANVSADSFAWAPTCMVINFPNDGNEIQIAGG